MKKYVLILLALITSILLFSCKSSGVSFDWENIELSSQLPKLESEKGEIHTNTESKLWIDVYKTSEEQYKSYISKCKEMGFVVDAKVSDYHYDAYNQTGYKLSLKIFDEEMTINLDAPMEIGELKWPDRGLATLIPAPESSVGKIEWETSNGFVVYVGKTTKEAFTVYADACAAKGFTVNYQSGDDYYYADDSEGNHLSLNYEGNNIMFVRMDAPSEELTTESNKREAESTMQENIEDSINRDVTFSEIYCAFKENKINAEDAYNDKYFVITAKINGMKTGGFLGLEKNVTTLTMEIQVENTIVFFLAKFDAKQREALKSVAVGDEISFIGKCDNGNFYDCILE